MTESPKSLTAALFSENQTTKKGPGLLHQSIISTVFQDSYRERCEEGVLGEQLATALVFIPPAPRSVRAHSPHKKYLSTKSPMHVAKKKQYMKVHF